MLIRSQSRKMLINLDNISHIRIIENKNNLFEIFVYSYNSQWIGDYSTKEKALKVLDMIQDAYERYNFFSITYTDGVLRALERQNGLEETRKQISSVFQMPQDSEV